MALRSAWSSGCWRPSRSRAGTACGGVVVPVAIAISAVPIIALAPIMSNWFGIANPFAKMAVVILLVFFPIMINVVRGLTEVPATAIELMRERRHRGRDPAQAAAAERAAVLLHRAQRSAPRCVSSARWSRSTSVAPATLLGRVIVQNSSRLRFDITWSAIIVTAAVGIAAYLIVLAIERLVIPWHASLRVLES